MSEAQYDLFGGSVPARAEGAPPPGSRKTASLLDWAEVQRRKAEAGRYMVKCDECKEVMRWTDSLAESAEGGTCETCRKTREAYYKGFIL